MTPIVNSIYKARAGELFIVKSKVTVQKWKPGGYGEDVVGFKIMKISDNNVHDNLHEVNLLGKRNKRKRKLHRYDLVEKIPDEEARKLHPELYI